MVRRDAFETRHHDDVSGFVTDALRMSSPLADDGYGLVSSGFSCFG